MIKNYTMLLLLFIAGTVFSQETISFETTEGYTLGTLNAQNGWEVTDDNEGAFLQNQVVTDAQASDGTQSFKNAFEPDFDFQWLPIFGAAKTFDTPKTYEDFVFSYDVMVTETMGADFEVTLFGIDANEDFVPVAGVAMEYQGLIYVIKEDYGYDYIPGATWTPNTWLNIKIEVNATNLLYYINDDLVYTDDNYSLENIVGFNMLHNNYGGSAYYDNFSYATGTLSIDDIADSSEFRVYPNPVEDELKIEGTDLNQMSKLSIFNISGQKIIESDTVENLNVSQLSEGVYLLKIETDDAKTYTRKLLKK